MKAHILDPEALRGVAPVALTAYAHFEGWEKVAAFGDFANIFVKTLAGRTREVLLPFTTDIADYPAAVSAAISVFADAEGRDELRVFRDLTRADRDVIRVRAPEADDDGSISVEPGVALVLQAREILAAAACSANDPRPAYHVNKVGRAMDYMRRVRLGQTEHGSFIVTLLAPIPPQLAAPAQQSLWPMIEEEPYERQVTRYLAEGLSAAHAAVNAINRGGDISAFNEAVPEGVSANLCEAIAGIIDQSDGADISVTWARTRPTPIERSRVTFGRPDAEILREAGRYFRLQEPRRDEPILGYVVTLTRPEYEMEGTVTLKSLIDGKERSLRVDLSQQDYEVALKAHEARAPVMLRGDVEMKGQRWRVTQPRELRIIGVGYDEPDPSLA